MSTEAWFYAEGSQKLGPVSTEELQELGRSGRVAPETLVWREGWIQWRPFSQAFADPTGLPYPPQDVEAVALQPAKVYVEELIGTAWEKFKEAPGLFIGLAVLWMLPSFAIEIVKFVFGLHKPEASLWIAIGFMLVNLLFLAPLMTCGFYKAMLKQAASGQPPVFEDFFPIGLYADRVLPFIGFVLCSIVLVLAGLLCFIFPGLFILLCVSYFGPGLVIDRRLGPWDAAIASIRVGWKNVWTVLLLFWTTSGLLLLGILACCVGLIVVLPLIQICLVPLFYARMFGISTLR